jgi:tRNA1(Val) A37 N6-methylase TrmN6
MLQALEKPDKVFETLQQIRQKHKSDLGQFMTPSTIAGFMASLFSHTTLQTIHLLDPGAGAGSLSSSFLERIHNEEFERKKVHVTAYEIDDNLRNYLFQTVAKYQTNSHIQISVLSGDFIAEAVKLILKRKQIFSHAILNPPYKKINSAGMHRLLLRQVEIETVNLYSAFVALTIKLMQPGGEIVAIIPRSFCNGPYYRPFRRLIFSATSIKHMHLFETRNRAFKDDDVLQENIILLLERDGRQGEVTVSTSTDDSFSDIQTHIYPFKNIVFSNDPEQFIHVPTSPVLTQFDSSACCFSLSDLDLSVSTGPVVDFRLKNHLRQMPEKGAVPLLYPVHFSGQSLRWPQKNIKKPNAIMRNDQTEKWLYPQGCYVVVRRFSSKEERRRIVASVIYPDSFDSPVLGLENHLNVFHRCRKGIPKNLARGLSVYLNSSIIDEQFRRFSGHTQVNATDLRLLKYPGLEALTKIGIWANTQLELTQRKIDLKIESLLCRKETT